MKIPAPADVHGIVDTSEGAIVKLSNRTLVSAVAFAALTLIAPSLHADDRSIGERLTTPTIAVTTRPYPGTSVEWGRAVGVVDAPADKVLAIVHDYAHYATFLPHFEASRVLSQRGTSALVYLEAKIIKKMVTIWAEMKLSSRQIEGGTHVVEGDMKKGNVDVMSARWEVTPIDANRTKVAFQLIMDPGVPMPASTITYFGAKATRQTLEALRSRLGTTPSAGIAKK